MFIALVVWRRHVDKIDGPIASHTKHLLMRACVNVDFMKTWDRVNLAHRAVLMDI